MVSFKFRPLRKVAKIVAVPVVFAGDAAKATGDAGAAVIVGTKSAVNGVIDGASGAGVKVLRGATQAASGVTKAATKLLRKTGNSVNSAIMKGGKRNATRKNKSKKDRKNKNKTNKNRKNKSKKNRKH